jgi:hypothetical protein
MIEYVINHKDSPQEQKFEYEPETTITFDEKQEQEKKRVAKKNYFERLQKDLFQGD